MMEAKNYWLYLHWLQMLDSADSHGLETIFRYARSGKQIFKLL